MAAGSPDLNFGSCLATRINSPKDTLVSPPRTRASTSSALFAGAETGPGHRDRCAGMSQTSVLLYEGNIPDCYRSCRRICPAPLRTRPLCGIRGRRTRLSESKSISNLTEHSAVAVRPTGDGHKALRDPLRLLERLPAIKHLQQQFVSPVGAKCHISSSARTAEYSQSTHWTG